MNNSIWLAALAATGGAAVALQGQFMGMMDRKIGTSGALFVNYASGVLVAAIILLLLQGGSLKNLLQVPWYTFSAGALGLVIAGQSVSTCCVWGFPQHLQLLSRPNLSWLCFWNTMGSLANPDAPSISIDWPVLAASW